MEKYPEFLTRLLDRPIAFHKSLIRPAGSVNAALMLSQALYWTKVAMKQGREDGVFYKTQDDWEEETGLSRFEQESARKSLRGTDFWFEDRRGVPAQLFYRVNLEKLQSRLLETSNQDCGKPADKSAGKPQSLPLSETTTETPSESTVESEREEDFPSKERENPQASYRAAKSIYRRYCKGNLGNLGEKQGEAWSSLLRQYGEKKVLGALEIWARELREPKKWDYPIALFLKDPDEFIEAYEFSLLPPEPEEEPEKDVMLTGKDVIREREERERESRGR
jgi:hypothetical protein